MATATAINASTMTVSGSMAPRQFSRNEIDLMVASLLGVNPLRSVQRIYGITRYTPLEHHRVRRDQVVRGRGELELHLGREHRDRGAQGMRKRGAAGGAASCAGNQVGKW